MKARLLLIGRDAGGLDWRGGGDGHGGRDGRRVADGFDFLGVHQQAVDERLDLLAFDSVFLVDVQLVIADGQGVELVAEVAVFVVEAPEVGGIDVAAARFEGGEIVGFEGCP